MDESILIWINQGWAHPAVDAVLGQVSQRAGFALPLLGLLLADAIRRAGWRGARLWLLLVLAVALGDRLGGLLKALYEQPRPCFVLYQSLQAAGTTPAPQCGPARNGMPSNHALNYFLAASLLLAATPWRFWRLAMPGVAILVALSRIYLGKHYPSQVLAGAAIGIALGLLAATALCYYRLCIPRPPNPDDGQVDPKARPRTRA